MAMDIRKLVGLALNSILILGALVSRTQMVTSHLKDSSDFDIVARILLLVAMISAPMWVILTSLATGALFKVTEPIKAFCLGISTCAFFCVLISHLQLLNIYVLIVASVTVSYFGGYQSLKYLRQIYDTLTAFFLSLTKRAKACFIILSLYTIPKFLEVFLPSGQGDALYYHLNGAMQWAKQGKAFCDPWNPWILQGGVFEYLYAAMGTLLMHPLHLLISGQFLHGFLGILISTTLLFQIARRLGFEVPAALIACIAFVSLAKDPLTLVRAKNDGFVLAMGLAAFYAFIGITKENTPKKGDVFHFVFLSATALAAKNTALFFLLPLFIISLWQTMGRGKSLKYVLQGSLIFSPLALSMLIRNEIYTENPFFPAMADYFPSPLMNESIREFVRQYGNHDPFVKSLSRVFWGFCSSKWFFFLFPLGLFIMLFSRERWFAFFFILMMLITVQVAGYDELSYRFSLFFIGMLSILSTWAMVKIYSRIKSKRKLCYGFYLIIVVSIFHQSGYEIPLSRLVRHTIPFWVKPPTFVDNYSQIKPLFTISQIINRIYHSGIILSDSTAEGLFLDLPIAYSDIELRANQTMKAVNFREFLQLVREHNFVAYLTRTTPRELEKHNSYPYFKQVTQRFPIVFKGYHYTLYDLRTEKDEKL